MHGEPERNGGAQQRYRDELRAQVFKHTRTAQVIIKMQRAFMLLLVALRTQCNVCLLRVKRWKPKDSKPATSLKVLVQAYLGAVG
jgi:hypothetical protein